MWSSTHSWSAAERESESGYCTLVLALPLGAVEGRSRWEWDAVLTANGCPLNQRRKHNWKWRPHWWRCRVCFRHVRKPSCGQGRDKCKAGLSRNTEGWESGVQDIVLAAKSPEVTSSVQLCHKQDGVEMAHGEKDKTKHDNCNNSYHWTEYLL